MTINKVKTYALETRNAAILTFVGVLGVAKETEPPMQISGMWSKAYAPDAETILVLKSLGSGKYTWRYLGSIAQETDLPLRSITKSLDWLVANKLVAKEQSNEGEIWGLLFEGRSLLSAIVATENFNHPKV